MTEHQQWLVILVLFLAFFIWMPWYITKVWREVEKDMRDWEREHEEWLASRSRAHQQALATIPADHFYDPVCDAVVTPDGELVDLKRFAGRTRGKTNG